MRLNNLSVQGSKQPNKWYQSEFTLIGLMPWVRSLIPAIMDNLKCLSTHICDDLNKKDTIVSVDLIDTCETLHKELFKSMKIAKKFKE